MYDDSITTQTLIIALFIEVSQNDWQTDGLDGRTDIRSNYKMLPRNFQAGA